MTDTEKAESQVRLQQEVERIKQLEAEGKRLPLQSPEEFFAEKNSGKNVVELGTAIKEGLVILSECASKAAVFAQQVRESIYSRDPEYCEDHPEQVYEIDEDASIEESWLRDSMIAKYKPCPKCQAIKIEASQRAKWLEMGIPRKVLHATLENFDTSVDLVNQKRVVSKFKKQLARNKGFIFALGTFGTGKTHLAAAAIKSVGRGIFITMHDLVGELRQTYSENTGQDHMVDRYRKTPLLVVDELSSEVFDPNVKKGLDIPPLLYRILGYRYDSDLLTIFTSNDSLEMCMAILGGKLRDRMREDYEVANFTWQSHRQKKSL